MAIKFEKTQVKGGFPVFWRGEREVLPGDFAVIFIYVNIVKRKCWSSILIRKEIRQNL